MTKWNLVLCVLLTAFFLTFSPLRGDVVETVEGARLTGRVSRIDAAGVVVETDYAGTVTVQRGRIASIVTDVPMSVRLTDGTRHDGPISSGAGGAVRIGSAGAAVDTSLDRIAATWRVGDRDPLAAAWLYEVSVDVAGKTGNREQLGTTAGLRGTLKRASDTLVLGALYDRQVTDGARSADKLALGADYQNNFSGRLSWYARDELGFDRVRDIGFYNVAGVGLGYDILKQPHQTLTGRAGVSHRHESYRSPLAAERSEVGLDVGLNHELLFSNSRLVNRVAWTPAFRDFGNYKLVHESFFEIPLADPNWKFRTGASTDYTSRPAPGLEKLDVTYFARLVLTWR